MNSSIEMEFKMILAKWRKPFEIGPNEEKSLLTSPGLYNIDEMDKGVYVDIVGTLAGISFKINDDYQKYSHNSNYKNRIEFYKTCNQLPKINRSMNTSLSISEKEYGIDFLPKDDFIIGDPLKGLRIRVSEYLPEEMHYLRMVFAYKRLDFFESLKPSNNKDKLKNLFENVSSRGGTPIYVTTDKKFIIKEIREIEKRIFINQFFEKYFLHCIKEESFICKFLGIFKLQIKYFN